MSNPTKQPCRDAARHNLHICQIKAQGLQDELAGRTDEPGFICHNCNAVANRAEDLCNASPLLHRT